MPRAPTKFKVLKSTHRSLDLAYVEQLHALYKGGRELLHNKALMARVFPRHVLEHERSYQERCQRAFYDNDFALVINKISAMLAADPYVFDDGGAAEGKKPEQELPAYWKEIQDDARPPRASGPRRSYDQVNRTTVVEAMVAGLGWTLCDLPAKVLDEQGYPVAQTDLDLERMKADRAYPVPYRADQVINWRYKGDQLAWVRTYQAEQVDDEPEDDASEYTRHTWRVWDSEEITTYILELDRENKDKLKREWKDDDLVPIADSQPHTFGVVPWVCLNLMEAPGDITLWLGDMIEGRCRALFNLACGDEYLRLRCAFQQLYEFTGKEMGGPDEVISDNQTNPNRAGSNMGERSPDIIQVRGSEDDARFVSPNMDGAALNQQAIADGREAIPRVTGQLALASDTSGAVLKRSGDSKAQDKVSEKVLALVIGTLARAHGDSVKEMLARGRQEDPVKAPKSKGYESFDTAAAEEVIEERVALATAPIRSAKFNELLDARDARVILGNEATPDDMREIRAQLSTAHTQDAINQTNMPPVPPGHELDETGKPKPLPTSEEQAKTAAMLKAKSAPPAKGKK